VITATFVVLLAAVACFAYRLVRGPSLADRVLAIDGLLVAGVAGIAADAMRTGQGAFLPVAVVITLVGFISTAIVARFIEGRGA
jgi:multisubunit Na+/H+ antiporter MnhF subunit